MHNYSLIYCPIEGLNQPCGLAIYGNKLYVGDQNKVHIIDIEKGKLITSLSADGAMTLNDVAISKVGQVFISDVMSGRIYTIENDKLVVWIENARFTHPNGLYVDGEDLIVADLGDNSGQSANMERGRRDWRERADAPFGSIGGRGRRQDQDLP